MQLAASRSIYHRLKALVCVVLILNLHFWLGGCGNTVGVVTPESSRDVLPLDHPLSQALQGSALLGATGIEIDAIAGTFRIAFVDGTQRLEGRYALGPDGRYTITEMTLGRQGASVEFSFDLSKRVTAIRTDSGIEWLAPPKPVSSSSSRGSESEGVQAYVDANAELLSLAREVDRQSGISGQIVTIPGSNETVDLSVLMAANVKSDSALIGSILLFVFSTMVLIWAPILGTLEALLSIFLVVALIQGMINEQEPPMSNPDPPMQDPPTGDPPGPSTPSEITDCNNNGVEDMLDVSSGGSEDCNSNNIPDVCESDTDNDGTIDPCDFDLTVTARSDRTWVYEHLVIRNLDDIEVDATNCPVTFSAEVTDDPRGNDNYTFDWSIEAPEDRDDAVFLELTGGDTNEEMFRPPRRPAYSPGRLPYVVTVVARGNQHGNEGMTSFEIEVRIVGDVDNSGCVDFQDDVILSAAEQGTITDPQVLEAADINCDGTTLFGLDSSIVGIISEDLDGFGSCISP